MLRLTAFAGVLVALLTFAALAGAQGRGANPHLTAAKEAASRDDWATALTEYLAADPDGKNPAVLKDIAEADEHLNHDDDAYEVYVRLGRLLATSKMNPRTRAALKHFGWIDF